MLDLALIRSKPEYVEQALRKRMEHVDLSELIAFDAEWRTSIQAVDELRSQRKKMSKLIGAMKGKQQDTESLQAEATELNKDIERLN